MQLLVGKFTDGSTNTTAGDRADYFRNKTLANIFPKTNHTITVDPDQNSTVNRDRDSVGSYRSDRIISKDFFVFLSIKTVANRVFQGLCIEELGFLNER